MTNINSSTYIQYVNKKGLVKVLEVTSVFFSTGIQYFVPPTIQDDFFILGLYDKNKRVLGVTFENVQNLDMIAFLNSEFQTIEVLPEYAFFPAFQEVVISKMLEDSSDVSHVIVDNQSDVQTVNILQDFSKEVIYKKPTFLPSLWSTQNFVPSYGAFIREAPFTEFLMLKFDVNSESDSLTPVFNVYSSECTVLPISRCVQSPSVLNEFFCVGNAFIRITRPVSSTVFNRDIFLQISINSFTNCFNFSYTSGIGTFGSIDLFNVQYVPRGFKFWIDYLFLVEVLDQVD